MLFVSTHRGFVLCAASLPPVRPVPYFTHTHERLRTRAATYHLLRPTHLVLQAVGEPPFYLGTSVFFALKEACYAARKDAGEIACVGCGMAPGVERSFLFSGARAHLLQRKWVAVAAPYHPSSKELWGGPKPRRSKHTCAHTPHIRNPTHVPPHPIPGQAWRAGSVWTRPARRSACAWPARTTSHGPLPRRICCPRSAADAASWQLVPGVRPASEGLLRFCVTPFHFSFPSCCPLWLCTIHAALPRGASRCHGWALPPSHSVSNLCCLGGSLNSVEGSVRGIARRVSASTMSARL